MAATARKVELKNRLLEIEAELREQQEQIGVVDGAVIDARQHEIEVEIFAIRRQIEGSDAVTLLAEVEVRGVHGPEAEICARFDDLSPSDLLAAIYATHNRASRLVDDSLHGDADEWEETAEAIEDDLAVVEAMAMVMATRLEPDAWRRAAALTDGDLAFEEPHPLVVAA